MNRLNEMKKAALLIEEMTGSRFKHSMGGVFIYPDRNEYFAVNMRKEVDFNARFYRIHFDVNLQTMGQPMDAAELLKLQQEIGTKWALLTALEIEQYALTPEEMQEFDGFVREREEQALELEQTQGPVMTQAGC